LTDVDADVAAVDVGIVEEEAGVNVPLTARVTNNEVPPLLK